VLSRWVVALDRYWIATTTADQEPLTEGSTGQSIANPLYKVAEQAMKVVDSCERQLGIGGLNASTLGLAAISERRSLQDMNAKYGVLESVDDPDESDDDPRLMIIDGG
ncbi:MAG: hypothetical protein ACRERD_29295, partial [Candidatus Binatia bacterium]